MSPVAGPDHDEGRFRSAHPEELSKARVEVASLQTPSLESLLKQAANQSLLTFRKLDTLYYIEVGRRRYVFDRMMARFFLLGVLSHSVD